MTDYDVIIVGAGPSGTIAGLTLAKQGLKVLIIEKTNFPRRKICGGGLTQRAFAQIPFEVSPVIHSSVNWGYLLSRGHVVTTIHQEQPIAYLIDRPIFDQYLLKEAQETGVECLMGKRITDIDYGHGKIVVSKEQEHFTCDYLVGADGVHSVVAKSAGLIPNRKTSLAIEARLKLPANPKQKWIDGISFDFGTVFGGYGWKLRKVFLRF
jgi:geranylgeranyl reductase family protein